MLRCTHKLGGFTLGKTYFLYGTLTDIWVEVENGRGKELRFIYGVIGHYRELNKINRYKYKNYDISIKSSDSCP